MSALGAGVVLYGERGVGKTSLCNVLLEGRSFVRYDCSSTDDFVTISFNILKKLGGHLTPTERSILEKHGYTVGVEKVFKVSISEEAEQSTKYEPVKTQPLDGAFVAEGLSRVQGQVEFIIVDEFQNVSDPAVQTGIIEVVKTLTDNAVNVRLLFAGSARSDDELITSSEYAQYKMRHFVAAELPRMSDQEIIDILTQRRNLFNVEFDEDVKRALAHVSCGLPWVAHSLALKTCLAWGTRYLATRVANAAKSVWAWFRKRDQSGVKLDELHPILTRRDFAAGCGLMLQEFENSQPKEAAQYREALRNWKGAEKAALAIAAAGRDGIDVETLVADSEEPSRVRGLGQEELAALVERDQAKRLYLRSGGFGPIIRCYAWLREHSAEAYEFRLNRLNGTGEADGDEGLPQAGA